ncbi:MAG: hypothetical protein ACRD4G_20285 [Bryobacteraceae bacterium]
MALNAQQKAAAQKIRAVRPAVLPGTNVIPGDVNRQTYYELVNRGLENEVDCDKPRDIQEFCDICGVPD